MQSLMGKFQKILVILVVFLTPLFFLPMTQEFYITGKFYFLTFGVLIILLVGALAFLLSRKISLIKTPFDKVVIMVLLTKIISVILSSPNKVEALLVLPNGLGPVITFTLLYFILVHSSKGKDKNLTLIKTLVFSSAIVGLITTIFFFEPLKNTPLPLYLEFLKNSRFSPAGNPLDTLYLLGFAALFSIVYFIAQLKTSKKSVTTIVSGIVALIAVSFIFYGLFTTHDPQQRIQLPPYNMSWIASVETLKGLQTAVVGAGTGNFEAMFTRVKPLSYNLSPTWDINFSLARSGLLQVWVETGLLGLVAMVLIAIYAIREIHGLYLADDPYRHEFAVMGCYLALLILFTPPSQITSLLIYVFLAELALRSVRHETDTVTINLDNLPMAYISIFTAGVVLIAASIYLTGRAYAAEFYFKKSIDAARENKGNDVYTSLVKAVQLNPYVEKYHQQFSQMNLLLANNIAQKKDLTQKEREDIAGLVQTSIAEAKVVVQLNPQKAANWNNLALVYRNIINVASGSDAWAIASYRRAILLDSNNPVLRLNLGGVYYSLNNYGDAIRLFDESVSLKPNWANAYYNLAWAQYQNKEFDPAITSMGTVLQLLAKDSQDHKKAQENLEAFKAAAKTTQGKNATGSGELKQGQELKVPTPPTARVSPPLELPQGTGPEQEIQKQPGAEQSPTPSQGVGP